MLEKKEYASERVEMIEKQLRRRGILDAGVLEAMTAVPRHEFGAEDLRGQTISQPYIVAAMTVALHLRPADRVLEIGTGCGYQAAVLARLAKEVFTIERRPELASAASAKLARLGYANAHVHCGDGTLGLPELAPFDAILVAAAAPAVPKPLLAQLAEGGRLVLPVGEAEHQELQLIEKHGDAFLTKRLEGCRFVPLVGYHGWQEPS
jgi:protein-L-isoaspartate(D-aspartate) O-methyltransferase